MTDGRGAGGDPGTPRRRDLRPGLERRVRRAWRSGDGAVLRLASAAYGLAAGLRSLAYEAGLAGTVRVPGAAVLSVGSLSVGGSGKTPVAAAAARWASELGAAAAVVTPGFSDELALHRSLNRDVATAGGRDRVAAARRARRRGADFLVLDDAGQHRRLGRDLDWMVVDERRAGTGRWELLPAGPATEPWGGLARADAVVLTRRTAGGSGRGHPGGVPDALRDRVGRQFPAATVARCELRPGPLAAANGAARSADAPSPRVAFASIMKGEDFLEALARRRPEIEHEFLFSDHAPVPDARLEEIIRLAGGEGIVGTRKDVLKVRERVADRTPLWSAEEELRWTHGEDALRRQLAGAAAGP